MVLLPSLSPFKWSVFVYILANVIYIFLELPTISNSTLSTGAIGYLFLPISSAFSCLPWALVGTTIGYILRAKVTKRRNHVTIALIGGAISLCFIGYTAFSSVAESHLRKTVLAIGQMNAEQLDTFVSTADLGNDKFALGAVCLNRQTTAETLARIAVKDDPELYEKMWSSPEIMGENTRGYAVMRLIAMHPNVTNEILVTLAGSPDPYVVGDIAGNARAPQAALEDIYARLDEYATNAYLLEWGLAANQNTPQHIVASLATSRNEYTLHALQDNPSTPPDIRQEIMRRLQERDYD